MTFSEMFNESFLAELNEFADNNDNECIPADCEIHVGDGTVFEAHRNVLQHNSDVFDQLLSESTWENQNGIIIMDNTNSELVFAMLQFMYTGKVDNFEKFAWNLLFLAMECEIPNLECHCLIELASRISLDTLFDHCDTLEAYHLPLLESDVLDFAMDNIDQVMDLPEWSDFISGQSKMAMQLLDRMDQLDITVKEEKIQFAKSAIYLFGC